MCNFPPYVLIIKHWPCFPHVSSTTDWKSSPNYLYILAYSDVFYLYKPPLISYNYYALTISSEIMNVVSCRSCILQANYFNWFSLLGKIKQTQHSDCRLNFILIKFSAISPKRQENHRITLWAGYQKWKLVYIYRHQTYDIKKLLCLLIRPKIVESTNILKTIFKRYSNIN